MSTGTQERTAAAGPKAAAEKNLPAIGGPRLPFHPMVEERFGIDRASWKALVEAVFPTASCIESVILALSYCRARKLDPFKRCVHIVPIWDKKRQCMVDTIWPGIGELRTTAFRTGEYAGKEETVFGPDKTTKVGSVEMTFPEWAQVTVHRFIKGQKVTFAGPKVWWLETYATLKRADETPNEMWMNRPRGQLDKCAEAAGLRTAFPEEIGGEYISDEVGRGDNAMTIVTTAKVQRSSLTDTLGKPGAAPPQESSHEEGDYVPPISQGQDDQPQGGGETGDEPQTTGATGEESQEPPPSAFDVFRREIEAANDEGTLNNIIGRSRAALKDKKLTDDERKQIVSECEAKTASIAASKR